ncbi:MAG TPA: hypothetical protein VK919_11205 [Solirubrobacterales bacterium]|nr:hypothetical protein [Solirubrobacterales bacterium]
MPEELHANGGFPEPPASAPARVVAARHDRCGGSTRVRLPSAVPAGAIRRLRCDECDEVFEADATEDLGIESAGRDDLEAMMSAAGDIAAPRAEPGGGGIAATAVEDVATATPDPAGWRRKLGWQWLSAPVGAAAVVAALLLIQGGEQSPPPVPRAVEAAAGAPAGARDRAQARRGRGERARGDARLLRGPGYALALPPGWRRDGDPSGGAALTVAADDGSADATLWVERAPDLDLASFEQRSLDQLRSLAGSAEVVERVSAPRPEGTIIRLAADAPPGEPRLEVTLRAAGPFRYYLATTVQPDAPPAAADGAELIHGSFTPEPGGQG